MKKIVYTIVFAFLLNVNTYGQELLSKENAIAIVLENNYNILLAKNTAKISKNEISILNGGYLPTLRVSAGANHRINTGESRLKNGDTNTVTNAVSDNFNASMGLGYNNVNIYNLVYSLKRLKETYEISEVQAKQVLENTLSTLFFAYYEVARLKENTQIQKQNLEISKERLKRAEYSFEYGQNTKLDVLNAQVDVNNDMISLSDVAQRLANSKRDLNLVLGTEVQKEFDVSTEVSFLFGLTLDTLLKNALDQNSTLEETKRNKTLSEYDIKISKSGWMPSVSLTSSYAWSQQNNDNTANLIFQDGKGINLGVSMAWNIFDGGTSIKNNRNAKIALESKKILLKQQSSMLERNVVNGWETYQNALFVLEAQKTNLATNELNFKRSEQRYKLGQINSIEFRQAQLNLTNAELNLSAAKYKAKSAELDLLQLSGSLVENTSY